MYEFVTDEEYEVAEKKGLSKKLINQRMENGWNKERALTEPTQNKKVDEWLEKAMSNGISKNAYQKRLRRGWTKVRASTEPIKGGRG